MERDLEQTIKRIERINRILTVAILAEIVVLFLFI
jgi:hypothetical protein